MAKSKETFNKRDKEKKKLEKKQEKAAKREERKATARKGMSLEDMMVYVDEDGNFTASPPDPKKRKEINHEEIELDIRKRQAAAEEDARRNGVISMFNTAKGYGFIRDLASQKSVFVHINAMHGEIKEGDHVSFDLQRTVKGDNAVNVQKKS
ncbi:MAG: cold-shock DNA-binding domain protein [Chitinophagaceae bacterium]|jgi:cold shock CspA family protein|nr:cold-shock DNA-binding domain protein [Chitinophagaceae bacterium]